MTKRKKDTLKFGNPGVPKPRWTKEELRILKQFYPSVENERLAALMQRSVASVVTKAHRLGLKKSRDFISMISRVNVMKRYAA
jgi:hypothetical protein